MLTKVSPSNHLATPNIIKFLSIYNDDNGNKKSKQIERIQDNMGGYLLIQYSDSSISVT